MAARTMLVVSSNRLQRLETSNDREELLILDLDLKRHADRQTESSFN